jgi:hypothetical protein
MSAIGSKRTGEALLRALLGHVGPIYGSRLLRVRSALQPSRMTFPKVPLIAIRIAKNQATEAISWYPTRPEAMGLFHLMSPASTVMVILPVDL